MSVPEILRVSNLPPFLVSDLQEVYLMHDREHITDPEVLGRIRGIVGGGESKIDGHLIAMLPKLEFISVLGVGYDGVDVQAAINRGIRIGHTPNVLNDDVADLAMGLLLSVARRIPQADKFVRNNDWLGGAFQLTRKLSGAKLGIVGLGRIGQAIARRAQAFDMSIAYTARTAKPHVPYPFFHSAAALAAEVDFLVIIIPGGEGTRGMINAEVLKALGPNGYVVNVARGSVMDQAALISALQNKEIAGAGLDVFQEEPTVPVELLTMNNVVLTPHMASGTMETRRAMADLVLANLKAHFSQQPIPALIPECRQSAPAT